MSPPDDRDEIRQRRRPSPTRRREEDHEDRFPRKSGSSGLLVLLIIGGCVGGLLLLMAVVGIGVFVYMSSSPGYGQQAVGKPTESGISKPSASGGTQQPVSKRNSQGSPEQPIVWGDVRVELDKVVIGKLKLYDIFQKSTSTSRSEVLQVHLRITNIHPTRTIQYGTWRYSPFNRSADRATMRDNLGKIISGLTWNARRPAGATPRIASIKPNETILEILPFTLPQQSASHLDLEFNGANFKEKGKLQFRIPTTFITKQ